MKRKTLGNGLTLVYEKKPGESVAIGVTVRVGSKDEPDKIMGISHFIEHMLFNGTTNRKAIEIASEIEAIGGELNAMTGTDRTFYYTRVPKKHFEKGLEILSDIIQNPLFDKKEIEKERKIILDEVNLTHDQPRFYQWVLFYKSLFRGRLGRETIGTEKSVKSIQRKDLTRFHSINYVPRNMVVTVVGNTTNIIGKVEKNFTGFKTAGKKRKKSVFVPRNKHRIKIEKRPVTQSYLVLGYQSPGRSHKDSFCLDIIRSLLGRGQSGRLFQEIRAKQALAYEVGVHHEASANYGFFSVYVNTDKKNIPAIKKIVITEFNKLKNLTNKDILDAKRQIEGEYLLSGEDNAKLSEQLGFFEVVKGAAESKNYIKKIRKVTLSDVKRVVGKYLDDRYTLSILEQN